MISKDREDAVSPIVGVMLMVVVTVVIAAVVIAFASGTVEDTSSSPMLMLEVGKLDCGEESVEVNYITTEAVVLRSVTFFHGGGDTIRLDQIKFSFVDNVQHIKNMYSVSEPVEDDTIEVLGKSGSDVLFEAGDTLKISIPYSYVNYVYQIGSKIEWAMYDIRTNTVLASGVMVVYPTE